MDQAAAMNFSLGRAEQPEGALGLGFAHPVVDAGEVYALPAGDFHGRGARMGKPNLANRRWGGQER